MTRNGNYMNKRITEPLIGAHISIAGGLEQALYRGASIGCTAIQIFTHSNRSWIMPPLDDAQIDVFFQAKKETGITSIAVHASYLINLASPKQLVYSRSIQALCDELARCELLKIPFLVLHPGSPLGETAEYGITRISEALATIFTTVPHHNTLLLLENMAGQGYTLGSRLEELAAIHTAIADRKRLGFCIDTCHAFAAGYSFTDPSSYQQFWNTCHTILGKKSVQLIHVNDSQGAYNSRVDRHADIGKGNIGIQAFSALINDPSLMHIPKILETPHNSLADDQRNLECLRSLLKKDRS